MGKTLTQFCAENIFFPLPRPNKKTDWSLEKRSNFHNNFFLPRQNGQVTLFAKNSDFSGSLLHVDCRHLLVKISHETYATSKRSLYSLREKHKKERQKNVFQLPTRPPTTNNRKGLELLRKFFTLSFFYDSQMRYICREGGQTLGDCENF